MESRIRRIRKMSKRKDEENWKFRSFLKWCETPSEEMDAIVHNLYRKVSSQIDCKTCVNCCKEILPVLDEEDIERFSRGLGISADRFKDQYLVKDEYSRGYTFSKRPCPFLKGKLCVNYDYRPKDCVSYPHLHKRDFISRLINVVDNCSICPIVFNVYEELKSLVWHTDMPDEPFF